MRFVETYILYLVALVGQVTGESGPEFSGSIFLDRFFGAVFATDGEDVSFLKNP